MTMSQTETENEKSALLIDDNLMSAVRVRGQLEAAGYRVQTSGKLLSPEQTEVAPELLLINLGSRTLNGPELVTKSKAQFPEAKVLGYCGHTEIEIRRAAKDAGIGRIFTNEQAMIELAELLSQARR